VFKSALDREIFQKFGNDFGAAKTGQKCQNLHKISGCGITSNECRFLCLKGCIPVKPGHTDTETSEMMRCKGMKNFRDVFRKL
jgi:hypothetical protein